MPVLEVAIAAAIAKLYLGYVIVAYLTLAILRDWFIENRLTGVETNELAFTIQMAKEKGELVYVQGFFDEDTNAVRAARKLKASQVDEKIIAQHSPGKVVAYS